MLAPNFLFENFDRQNFCPKYFTAKILSENLPSSPFGSKVFKKWVKPGQLFVKFPSISQHNDKFDHIKAKMVCLGFEPG